MDEAAVDGKEPYVRLHQVRLETMLQVSEPYRLLIFFVVAPKQSVLVENVPEGRIPGENPLEFLLGRAPVMGLVEGSEFGQLPLDDAVIIAGLEMVRRRIERLLQVIRRVAPVLLGHGDAGESERSAKAVAVGKHLLKGRCRRGEVAFGNITVAVGDEGRVDRVRRLGVGRTRNGAGEKKYEKKGCPEKAAHGVTFRCREADSP